MRLTLGRRGAGCGSWSRSHAAWRTCTPAPSPTPTSSRATCCSLRTVSDASKNPILTIADALGVLPHPISTSHTPCTHLKVPPSWPTSGWRRGWPARRCARRSISRRPRLAWPSIPSAWAAAASRRQRGSAHCSARRAWAPRRRRRRRPRTRRWVLTTSSLSACSATSCCAPAGLGMALALPTVAAAPHPHSLPPRGGPGHACSPGARPRPPRSLRGRLLSLSPRGREL